MKKTDLEKNKGLKIEGRLAASGVPARFGAQAAAVTGAQARREQRKTDQAAGLVPFAVKLNIDLVARLQALAVERQLGMNELVAEVLAKGLGD